MSKRKNKNRQGFVFNEAEQKVLEALRKHGIYPSVPLDRRSALGNFGAINFVRRVRIAGWIASSSKVDRKTLFRKARMSSTSPRFFNEWLDQLEDEGIIQVSGSGDKREYEWIG